MICLSICIPTYNRSGYLRETLESIVSQKEFLESDEVEIIISDNCSPDDTPTVAKSFVDKYPTKIKYNRNPVNIADNNYEKVLSLASGAIMKLNNDTLKLNEGALGDLLKAIKRCIKNNTIPFLANGRIKTLNEPVICDSPSAFITTVSYFSTWIASFCISREEFLKVKDFSAKTEELLTQVYVIMNLLEKKIPIEVIPETFFTSVVPAKRGGYNLAKIFLTHYFGILRPHFKTKEEVKVFKKEKETMLYAFFLSYLADIYIDQVETRHNFEFDTSGYKSIIKEEFPFYTYIIFRIRLNYRILLGVSKILVKRLIGYNKNK
ncbi:glycosyltransferase family 2 protein [Mucilaginibacter mali]|uniref:Glycosyltransferase family 2 protein n=1 Tax=Mucilaginibacter mali TaxID=2740462 RepID=A0A7D4Q2N7_9SPHI|nr:glycosyltransferase family 2 protein [Mucilaginibacter mali]QKJ31486.1 glycosyltransferase family 2 protein [Mucilaginibacter mali]